MTSSTPAAGSEIDPAVARFLELRDGHPIDPLLLVECAEPNREATRIVELRAALDAFDLSLPRLAFDGEIDEITIQLEGRVLRARVYRPRVRGTGTVVYLHGGGFIAGSIDTHDNPARVIAQASTSVTVSIDYRLAPEAAFPHALEDAIDSIQWAQLHSSVLGGGECVAVVGDSAGANLALAAAHSIASRGLQRVDYQLLFYPVLDLVTAQESKNDGFADAIPVDVAAQFNTLYAPPALFGDPRVSPVASKSFDGMPPGLIITAGADPLRDEGERYALRAASHGADMVAIRAVGQVHGFLGHTHVAASTRSAAWVALARLRDVL